MYRCLERARGGDPKAKTDLVESLRPRIRSMAGYYARCCGEDADDLLQEAWLGLLEALPQVDVRIGSPEQYLIQHARWRVLDTIKRARVRRCAPLEEDTLGLSAASSDSETAASAACVSEFTGRLSSTHKVVLSCLLDGMTWRETGSVLGCTSANIAYHVRQIRRQYEDWVDGLETASAMRRRARSDRVLAAAAAQSIELMEA